MEPTPLCVGAASMLRFWGGQESCILGSPFTRGGGRSTVGEQRGELGLPSEHRPHIVVREASGHLKKSQVLEALDSKQFESIR